MHELRGSLRRDIVERMTEPVRYEDGTIIIHLSRTSCDITNFLHHCNTTFKHTVSVQTECGVQKHVVLLGNCKQTGAISAHIKNSCLGLNNDEFCDLTEIENTLLPCDKRKLCDIRNGMINESNENVINDCNPSEAQSLWIFHKHTTRVSLDPYLAWCVVKELKSSRTFCRNATKYLQYKFISHHTTGFREPQKRVKSIIRVPRLLLFVLQQPSGYILDYLWCLRVLLLVEKRIVLDDTMAWLNTLGGGYSALGDYFTFHAKEAGKLSLRQLKLALEMGDPPTVYRCHLYSALSLMQTGRLRCAKRLIRQQWAAAKRLPVEDKRLLNMCQGMWSRLRYQYRLYKRPRQVPIIGQCHGGTEKY